MFCFFFFSLSTWQTKLPGFVFPCFSDQSFWVGSQSGMIEPPTHPEFPLPVPWLRGDLWDFDDFCSLVRSSVSYSISLSRESSRLGYSLSSPFPCPFQMQGPGWLQESTYSGSNPSQGVFFGALQGFFSLLIPKQQDQRAMRVPCTRDVLPLTLTARAAGVGPPDTSFGVIGGGAPTTPGWQELLNIPNSRQGVEKHLRAWRPPSRG